MRKYANEKPPLRAELFTADQMAQYSKSLALSHKTGIGQAPDQLLKRLADNEDVLVEVHDLLTETVIANRRITPAGEWLLDNFYLIEDQIRTGKKHLPKGYSESLPWLSGGPSEGLPRVYDIALGIISHSDGRVDAGGLSGFIAAYQSITHLELGELWAIPIMLRLALIENLRRVAVRIAIGRINRNLADYWADKMKEIAEKDPKSLILVIADMARSDPPMESSFVAELTRRLQGKGPTLALPLTWMEQRLSEMSLTSNDLVQQESQKQAADQVSMSNSIGSLRFLANMDWREFIETMSIVEQTLREDIDGVYSQMDFHTRDHYRHVVEKIAKISSASQHEVARIAIELGQKSAARENAEKRTMHVGYYLVDKGLAQTEKLAKAQFSFREKLKKWISRYPTFLYAGSITLITLAISGGLVLKAYSSGIANNLLTVVAIFSILSASQLAVSVVNWIVTLLVKPSLLPRMDYSKGIAPESRTLVVVPALFNTQDEINTLVEALEVRFLANRDENLYFGLLTDFKDAPQEKMPEDDQLLESVKKLIEGLNQKYGSEKNELFFLFHRPRKWNPKDKIWMGYERKRGKLTDLNSLLHGGTTDNFSCIVGEPELYTQVKYVITLDSDTQLPRDSAWKLTATLSHPLNRARYSKKKKRVVQGYGILQPRVAVSLAGSNRSWYAQMHANDSGLDPYTRAVSDVYQDLFREGSFIGKGIYEVEIFEQALNDRFPENRILSHDLLEGCYTRSGFLSDVQLYEEYPASYRVDVSRRHRWIRGDWQIGGWLLPFVPGSNKRLQKNPLSTLSRWKIFDNVRRSLVPIALTLLLVLGWTVLESSWFWTLSVIAIIILPSVITTLWNMIHRPEDVLIKQHIKTSIRAAYRNFIQALFTIICLPFEAFYHLDAIILTTWRMLITRKKLLEWNPSGNLEKTNPKGLVDSFRTMWIGPFMGLAIFVSLVIYNPIALIVAIPILILWILSPAVAWIVSLPFGKKEANLTPDQTIFLQMLARKTWAFFEKFVGPEDNWLPPDNFQEHPVPIIAHRTSPTNIGLSLLANLSAYDFGYITVSDLLGRTANTVSTMEKMEKFRGHFYNWYDTETLQLLPPRYVSTVDSGNLAGHLLTLRQGLISLPHQKILSPRLFEGLRVTLRVLENTIDKSGSGIFTAFKKTLDPLLTAETIELSTIQNSIEKLAKQIGDILQQQEINTENETYLWSAALAKQCQSALSEIAIFTPWVLLPQAPQKFSDVSFISELPTLHQLARIEIDFLPEINRRRSSDNTVEENQWLDALQSAIVQGAQMANEKIVSIDSLVTKTFELADMEYDFLHDKSKHLLSIGYNVEEHRRDPSYYDLLASEARLCTFVAIAQGKLPQESWFALGRLLTNTGGDPILLSWSGSMFEYLMPLLVMPTYENTLLDQTNKATVESQIEYGSQRGVAWGVSESGYNMVDANFNYQYRAFGVPGLGLKRGLGADLVIAPYASVMALMVSPEAACENLEQLAEEGFAGRYGFYEAIDYTSSRLPRGQSFAVVKSFMVHHQGMSFLSLAYLLLDRPMQKRFESEPQFQATLLLLQERIPKTTSYFTHTTDVADTSTTTLGTAAVRLINNPNTAVPEVQLLSNGRYHVMVTNAGGGYSRWKDISVTRWREDSTCDNWGTFCYIREENGSYWSAAHQPVLKQVKNYEVTFSQGHAEYRLRDKDFETKTEIIVSPEDDIEMRRVRITNKSRSRKSIEITSYTEVVLTSAAADMIHPAFSNLFVQTEIIPDHHAILCTRRPRSVEDKSPWMFHLMKAHGAETTEVSYETDRMKFIGRGNTISNPDAMNHSESLSNTQGSVLDPIVSIRYRIFIEPDETAIVDLVFGIAETREICQGLIEKYQDRILADRAIELSWTHSQVILQQINATEADAQLYGRLASSIIYVNPSLRADPSVLIRNHRGQSALWSYSISGDLPIVLLQISDSANIALVKQLVQAHAYWRLKGMAVDLVIWNEDQGGYRQVLQEQILSLMTAGIGANMTDRPGGIFVRNADQISMEDRILLQTVARVIITDTKGTLADQVNLRRTGKTAMPNLIPSLSHTITRLATPNPPQQDLQFFNGLGGFTPNGREYKITVSETQRTPAPWVNVIANAKFGTVISESGQSYTWAMNAHEYRLTPWNNDPVSDRSGEAFYIRDEESGYFWSPAPLPVRGSATYTVRHGFGYSVFECTEDGIYSELWVYVSLTESIKFNVLRLKNNSGRARRLTITGYAEWVLGDVRSKSVMHIVTELDTSSGALFAKNQYNSEFNEHVAFFDVDDASRYLTGDRTEFIGRNGSLKKPDAMFRSKLSGRTGAALDPCAAIQISCDLAIGQERDAIFRLGTGINAYEASITLRQFRGLNAANKVLEEVHEYWEKTLGALQVETPNQALNILTNGWLVYQTLACRLWARSGFYQSGGAFGFRDQLQDVIAIIHTEPALARAQILLGASRQFKEGDVQHWWHPPSGRGVRTRCSDDFLWLPFVTSRYVLTTGDTGILEERSQFLEGRSLNPGEESYYDLPRHSDISASLYEHCVQAIQKGLAVGEHGLPLIGSGDWNDGMDMVGRHGRGESVWLGWFLYSVLKLFSKIALIKNDNTFSNLCIEKADQLKLNIDRHAWDGEWYRRAYFDDGAILGSATNDECQIDSIAQSWSVLSGAGNPQRAQLAMESVNKRLVRRDIGLIQLLDPPFDKSVLNPGYIKGYVPGVRENGGQYTHAAIWMVMASAAIGNSSRAWELFDIINPINHGKTKEEMLVYKVEPYVVAADVYASPQHKGRGGWTWYTGSSGWMYQLIVESLLGLRLEVDKLHIAPSPHPEWKSFSVKYRFRNTFYLIKVIQKDTQEEIISVTTNGSPVKDQTIHLVDDQLEHSVEIHIPVKPIAIIEPLQQQKV
ncbi:MAG: cyclic beta 1-2 glucan synthetase [Chitinophagaceae bacterium]|nr:cyclic beta 1-2 glucan synthetase [Chitinophagaceae bacterium]